MKKLITILLIISSFGTFAKCDWKSGIKKLPSGDYHYTRACHGEVGVIGKALANSKKSLELRKKESEVLRKQITELKLSNDKALKSIELKDLALKKTDQIALRWRDETYNQHDRLLKQTSLSNTNKWVYFAGGVVLTGLSVWAAGQLVR